MVSKRTHIIQRLIAEPEYHGLSVRQAELANDVISLKIRMELESQLERLFNELVPENLILTVDKISIELDEMKYEELEGEYVKRVLAKVRIEILKYIPEGFSQAAGSNFLYSEVLNTSIYNSYTSQGNPAAIAESSFGNLSDEYLLLEGQTVEVGAEALEAYYKLLESEQSLLPESPTRRDEAAVDLESGSLTKENETSDGTISSAMQATSEAGLAASDVRALQAQIIEDFKQIVPRITVSDLEIVIYFLQFGTYPQGVIPSESFDFSKIIFDLIDFYPKQFYEKLAPILTRQAVGARLGSLDEAILQKIKDVHLMEQLAKLSPRPQDRALMELNQLTTAGLRPNDLSVAESNRLDDGGVWPQDSPMRELDRGTLSLDIADKIGSVLYFMNYGSLPWWNNFENLGQLITELYQKDSELDFFRYKTNLSAHLPALLNATDGSVVRILMERSLKSFASLVGLQQEVTVLWMQQRKVSRQQFDNYAKDAWFMQLSYFLERGFDTFDKDDFVLSAVDQLHRAYGVTKNEILADFLKIEKASKDQLLKNWILTVADVFEPTLAQKETYLNVESLLVSRLKEILTLRDFHYALFEAQQGIVTNDFFKNFFTQKRPDSGKLIYEQLLLRLDLQILALERDKETLSIDQLRNILFNPAGTDEMQSWPFILQGQGTTKQDSGVEQAIDSPETTFESSKSTSFEGLETDKVDLGILLQMLVKVLKNKDVYSELLKVQAGKSSEVSDYKFKQLLRLIKAELLEKNPEMAKELLKYKLQSIEKQSIEALVPQIIKFYEEERLFELSDQATAETKALHDYIYQLKLYVKIKLTTNSTPWWNEMMAERDLDSVLVDLIRVVPDEVYRYIYGLYRHSSNKKQLVQYFLENTAPNIRYQLFKERLKPQLGYFSLLFYLDRILEIDSWDLIIPFILERESFEEADIITFWISESLQAEKFTIEALEEAVATEAIYQPLIKIWELMKEEQSRDMKVSTNLAGQTVSGTDEPAFVDEQFVAVNGQSVPAAEILNLFIFFLQRGHLPLDTLMLPLEDFELAIKKVSLLMPEKFTKSIQQVERNQFTRHLVFKYFSEDFYRYLLQYYLHGNADILEKWSAIFLENSRVEPAIVRTHAIDFARQANQPNLNLAEYTKDLVRFILRATQSKAYVLIPELVADFERVASDESVQNILIELKQIQSQLVKIPKLVADDGLESNTESTDSKESREQREAKELPITKPLFVRNAGLVLLWPFFVHFFKFNELLDKDNKFKTVDDAKRAVHLLQYLACKQTNSPEIDLTLNKILCGLPINTPIPKSIEMSEKEIEVAESLLQACITQWPAIKNTTPDGLRGSFLIRDGYLSTDASQNWVVKVEGKAWDILLERLNWGLSMIKLSWVKGFIYIEWRKSAI